jgi:Tol biopolymer transport system component
LLFESKDLPGPIPLEWSHDGKYIIFRTNAGNGDLYALPLAGDKRPIPLAARPEFNETQGQLSPDGRWFAYSTTESGGFKVVVIPFIPGVEKPLAGKWQISTGDGGVQPRWRADSKELYYMALGRLMAVDINATAQSFDHSTPHRLFESRADQPSALINWSYLPSPDGKRFLIAVPAGATTDAPEITVAVNWLAKK